MIKAIISDFSRTLLFSKDPTYLESLNDLYKKVKNNKDFEFWNYFKWNKPLHNIYKKLNQNKGINIYIFTTDKIQEDPSLTEYIQEVYKDVFTLKDVQGLLKNNPASYKFLAEKLSLNPSEILFIDDSEANLLAASEIRINTIKYTEIDKLNADLIDLGLEV